jgi:hypothetical protein
VSAFARANMVSCNTIDCGGKAIGPDGLTGNQKPCVEYYSSGLPRCGSRSAWWLRVVSSGNARGTYALNSLSGSGRWSLEIGVRLSRDEMKLKTAGHLTWPTPVAVGFTAHVTRGFVIPEAVQSSQIAPQQQWKRDLQERSRKLWRSGQLTHT